MFVYKSYVFFKNRDRRQRSNHPFQIDHTPEKISSSKTVPISIRVRGLDLKLLGLGSAYKPLMELLFFNYSLFLGSQN